MKTIEPKEIKEMHSLIRSMNFLGDVCVKIDGILNEAEVFRVLQKEFIKLKRHTLGILSLTDNGSKLMILKTSLSPVKIKELEKILKTKLEEYKIDLNKSTIFSQVVKEEKIIEANVNDVMYELFPKPVVYTVSKIMGYKWKNCILAPLYKHKKVIGLFIISSTQLSKYFIPLVRNFAQHVSQTIELAEENAKRRRIEKKLRESEKRLQNIIASSPDAITVTDLKGNIIECSQATINMHGFSQKKELIGKNSFELIAPNDRKRALENMKKILKQGFLKDIEYTFLTKNGYEFPAELSASIIRNSMGKPVAFMAITKNIFKRKEIDRTKNEFVSIASHQLRTPLTIMNWYSEMLLNGELGGLNKKQGKYLEEIYKANQRLIKLTSLLLNVSRMELDTFAIELEQINLIEIADSVLSELFPKIKNKKLKVEKNYSESPLIINADSNIIRIIFQNLLSNAVKYTDKEGVVRISIKKQKSYVLIEVSDNGYGIPKVQQSKIFTKFFRTDNAKEKEPDGSGLGLYIVKLIVEKSGGKIWFKSEDKKGTTFYIKIPLQGMKKKKEIKKLNINK